MTNNFLDITEPVTLIGGGALFDGDFDVARALAPDVIAADGGADAALAAGVPLRAVVGDMDSISSEARQTISDDCFFHIAEQDSTDFEKALRMVASPLVVAIGFSGGRVDHTLATMHTLARHPSRNVVVLTEHDVVFHCPRRLSLGMPKGTRVSLFPMKMVTGRSKGLHWPIAGLVFAPGVLSGTSNRATGEILLEFDCPGMLCVLPRCFIQPVVSALLALSEPAQWRALEG